MEHNNKLIDRSNPTSLSQMKDALNKALQSHARQSQEYLAIAISQEHIKGQTLIQK